MALQLQSPARLAQLFTVDLYAGPVLVNAVAELSEQQDDQVAATVAAMTLIAVAECVRRN